MNPSIRKTLKGRLAKKRQHAASDPLEAILSPLPEAEVPTPPKEKARPLDPLGTHYGSNGQAECGANEPNMGLTKIAANVTCPTCRGYLPIVAPEKVATLKPCPVCLDGENLLPNHKCPRCERLKPIPNPVMKPDPLLKTAICPVCNKALGRNHACLQSAGSNPPIGSVDRPQNSPKARDERMLRKGRLPEGSRFVTQGYDSLREQWTLFLEIPGTESPQPTYFHVTASGIHAALEALWGRYLAWKAEQAASAGPKEAS